LSTALDIRAVDPVIETLEIQSIDRSVQVRIKTDRATVEDYARALLADPPATFPPVICFRDRKTGNVYLADGNHRLESRLKNGETAIEADVREGGKREALAYALGSSKGHGLRFSNADKRKAVALALTDSKLKKLSDNSIAGLIGVSQPFVSKLRGELITVIKPTADEGNETPAAATDNPPKPIDNLPRLVDQFRKLLGKVPEETRTAFADRVVAILSES
jgi:hypothetical protein